MSQHYRCVCTPLSLAVLVLIAGCPDRQVAKITPEADIVSMTDLRLDDNRDIDILFVIDNSNSMTGEQQSLADNFGSIADVIRGVENQLSVHLGVISTDVTSDSDSCPRTGDDGALLVGSSGCSAINDGSPFIVDLFNDDGSRTTNYDGDLGDAFSCMANLGTGGCGFEQPLEAVKRALENPANSGFFRETAYLAIIFITDEDDCSIKDAQLMSDDRDRTTAVLDSELGPVSSFRCFEFGVQCDDVGNVRQAGTQTNCIPREESPYVKDIASYVEAVRGAKGSPALLFVAAIAGDLEPIAVEQRPSANDRYSFDIPQLAFSCKETGLGEAVPPIRLNAFLNSFEQRQLATLCQDDLTGAVAEIAEFISSPGGPPCLKGALADTSDEPGVQPACSIVEVSDAGLASESQRVLDECDNLNAPQSSSTIPCFVMYEDTLNCSDEATGLAVDVIYPEGFTVPPLTVAEVSCVGLSPQGP